MSFEAAYSAGPRASPLVSASAHQPAMVRETLHHLSIRPNGVYVDGTCGSGGHSHAIAKRLSAAATLLCLDLDPEMAELTRQRLRGAKCTALVRHASYADLPAILREEGIAFVDGVLLDLGVCSAQLDDPGRGFSFRLEGPLNMLYDPGRGVPAVRLVNRLPEQQLANLFSTLAQEKHARAIARAIATLRRHKPFKTTTQLAQAISSAIPPRDRHARLHPATRVFLALRLVANDELGHLQRALEHLPFLLSPNGRIVILCYESQEDQEVKRAFRRFSGHCVCPPGIPVCQCGAGLMLRVLTPQAHTPLRTRGRR